MQGHTGTFESSLARPSLDEYWPLLGIKLMVAAGVYGLAWGVLGIVVKLLSVLFYLIIGAGGQAVWRLGIDVPRLAGAGLVAALLMAVLTVVVSLLVLPVLASLSRSSIGRWLPDRPGKLAGGCVATLTIAPLWQALLLLPRVPQPQWIGQALWMALVAIVVSQFAGALASPADVLRASSTREPAMPSRFNLSQLLGATTIIAIVSGLAVSLPRFWVALGGLLLFSLIVQASSRHLVLRGAKHLLKRRFARRRAQRLTARST